MALKSLLTSSTEDPILSDTATSEYIIDTSTIHSTTSNISDEPKLSDKYHQHSDLSIGDIFYALTSLDDNS
ncbi:MAG: hypothetical protein AB8U25_04240 [Rickettsiales endosymbiont of Dermacentor nuttalli]